MALINNLSSSSSSAAAISRKRSRESLSFQQHILDVDRIIVHHAEKVRMELTERRKRFSWQILAAAEEAVSKRLKAKEEEIERIGKLNWALEERIKSLGVENQLWRYLAQTNEAAANVLRNNLEQVLAEQVKVKEEQRSETASPVAEDAESCCCGDNWEEEWKERATAEMKDWKRRCRNCNDQEPSVLLLPCRHLCLCAACGPAINECPICKCSSTGSVIVNLS